MLGKLKALFSLGKLGRNISRLLKPFFGVDKEERVKLALLTFTFFFIIASYTLVKELKDSIFMTVIGKGYLPWVKIVSIATMIPAIMFYAFLVDKMRRAKLLAFYSFLYGFLGLVFAYYMGHPTIGLANTVASPNRIFGWLFYFFIEGYSPFIVGVFWAFANSITSPKAAKKNYGLMVSGSKLGGLLSALGAWYFLSPNVLNISGVAKHQILTAVSAMVLLFAPFAIWLLIKYVPGKYMHGYEAAYKLEKAKAKEGKEDSKVSILGGLKLLIQHPYVLGIFGFIFFYEVSFVVLNYQRMCLIDDCTSSIAGLSREFFWQISMVHLAGCIFSLFGTSALMRRLGERKCLMLVPIVSGLLFTYFIVMNTLNSMVAVFVLLRALNYAFSYPVRESLYIPTVKEIKFKSKSWIDAFGTKIAKAFGSSFNIVAFRVLSNFGGGAFLAVNGAFLFLIVAFWALTAFLLGKRFEWAVNNNEVIGASKSEQTV